MSENSCRVQFRLSGFPAEMIKERAKNRNISDSEAAKELLIERCEGDQISELNLKLGIRILTTLQRFIHADKGDLVVEEIITNASQDEREMLKSLGVYSEE